MFGFGSDNWSQAKELFERQFEPERDHFLYRRNQKGPPIRVSSDERDRFINDYALRLRRGTRGTVGGMLLLTALAVWWMFQTDSDVPDIAIYAGMGAIVAALIGYTLWAWGAPAREMARRMPTGRERTRTEVSRIWLKNMSYGRLAGT
ncbi:MAG TPA: hypothetical protein VFR52_01525, partial [Sphingomicrobium sp.]|nr:hypothetical protein [Sphingomicrobium sp.]